MTASANTHPFSQPANTLAPQLLASTGSLPIGIVTPNSGRRWWVSGKGGTKNRFPRQNIRNILIVGAGEIGRQAAAQLTIRHPRSGFIVGFLDDSNPVGGDVLGRVNNLHRVSISEFVDEVIVALPNHPALAKKAIAEARSMGLDVKLVPDLLGFAPKTYYGHGCEIPILTLDRKAVPELSLRLKRLIDILLSLLGIVSSLPLLAAISMAVKLDSSGPVLYRAPRVGKKGARFECFKFRTMITAAERWKPQLRLVNERCGAFFKLEKDPRITRIGKFLRRYSLDELPQLWNVFRGEMSLVGPRPHPLDDFENYEVEDLRRLIVTPGITGLWQVTARRDPSFQRNVALDLEYIQQWSLWLDLKILCKTIVTVLQGSGS